MTAIASRAQLRMSYLRWALVTVPSVLLLGTLSGVASNSGSANGWFAALRKPAFMPSAWLFPAAWTILYIGLGLALALILHARGARGRPLALSLFFAQLALNLAWSPLFFAAHKISLAFWTIVAMTLLASSAAFLFYRIRRAAGLLMLPYLAWLLFAGVLNHAICTLNPDAELAPPASGTDIPL
jgi:tryptophan-rich sensory protein